uniref:Uncharacterized protein n=1 Tax=Arundo donax TaxID=35708 RepID=A0A0A8ZEA1_ARUDO
MKRGLKGKRSLEMLDEDVAL